MARREWADLSQAQRDNLERNGISQATWDAGASPISSSGRDDPPNDPPETARSGDEFPDPDELDEAVSDPDAHADFWWARGGGRLSSNARADLEDKALRNLERQVGDAEKFSRKAIAERLEASPRTPNQLRVLAAMDEAQIKRMAEWARQVYVRTGSKSFTWLFYH